MKKFIMASLMLVFGTADALPSFRSTWNAAPNYGTQCEAHGGFDVAWDPTIGVWAMKFAVQLDGTGGWIELMGVKPQPCEGGLPAGWSERYGYVYNLGRLVKISVYWRAPFDIETGRYYNLLRPYGKHWVLTSSCLEDNAGWCLHDLNEIEMGGYDIDGTLVISTTSSRPGVVLETQCAPAESCLPLQRDRQYDKVGTTWGAVKGLYH